MADLKLNLVFGSSPGRFQSLFDKKVKPEGIEINTSRMGIDELFWRIPTQDDIDVCELSLTGYLWGIQTGKKWTAIPVFPGWVLGCHTETLVREGSGIEKPEDLKGKKVGVPEFPVTAIAWIRNAFATRHGVPYQSINWFEERSNDYSHYRPLGYSPPKDTPVTTIPKDKRLCDMLIAGELDAVTRYFGRAENATKSHPGDRSHMSLMELSNHPKVKWLYPDRKGSAMKYTQDIGYLQPIHCVIVKQEIVDKNPWVPMNLYNAFAQAAAQPSDVSSAHAASFKVSKEEEAQAVGAGWTPVGLKRHRACMTKMLELCYEQGYVSRGKPFTVEEYFHPSTHGT
jgi:4,5-dihydroxyphthalate decarboxylase